MLCCRGWFWWCKLICSRDENDSKSKTSEVAVTTTFVTNSWWIWCEFAWWIETPPVKAVMQSFLMFLCYPFYNFCKANELAKLKGLKILTVNKTRGTETPE